MKKLFTKKDKRTELDKAIDILHAEMEMLDATDETYQAKLEVLSKLYEMKEKQDKNSDKLSKDTILVVAGNLIGIGLILNYERVGVVASKAMSFVIKGRA